MPFPSEARDGNPISFRARSGSKYGGVFHPRPSIVLRSMQEASTMPQLSFTRHPQEVGETYAEHMATAFGFGTAMLRGGLACLIHGLLPFLCTTTGSATIRRLHDRMVVNRVRHREAAPAEAAREA